MLEDKVTLDRETYNALMKFLNRVGNGYIELSRDKVFGEYIYYKNEAKKLKYEVSLNARP